MVIAKKKPEQSWTTISGYVQEHFLASEAILTQMQVRGTTRINQT